MSNELFRKKVRRKATKKKKEILKQLKVQMGKELTSNSLRIAKEQWIDKLRYKQVKLENISERERESKTTSSSSVTKKVFSKQWKEARPKKETCL